MKHLKLFYLLTLFSLSQADIIKIAPDSNNCSVDNAIKCLSKGLVDLTSENAGNKLEGLEHLLSAVAALAANCIERDDISRNEKCEICDSINDANLKILDFIKNNSTRALGDLRSSETDKQTMLEGLKQIVSGAFSLAVGGASSGSLMSFMTVIFGGILKVLSAIFADGKIDNQDWSNLKDAITSLLSGKNRSVKDVNEELFF